MELVQAPKGHNVDPYILEQGYPPHYRELLFEKIGPSVILGLSRDQTSNHSTLSNYAAWTEDYQVKQVLKLDMSNNVLLYVESDTFRLKQISEHPCKLHG